MLRAEGPNQEIDSVGVRTREMRAKRPPDVVSPCEKFEIVEPFARIANEGLHGEPWLCVGDCAGDPADECRREECL
jgi:hypothetical protein